jgi:hypothetical protein
LEKKLSLELENVLMQEELTCFQKERSEWIVNGDLHTKYFHTRRVVRRRILKIELLQDSNGEWISDPRALEHLAVHFFRNLFSHETEVPSGRLGNFFPADVAPYLSSLERPFTETEIWEALRAMKPTKAPGPDGFHAIFYQSNWEVVGHDVIDFMNRVFLNPKCISAVNDTLLVFIPKVQHPTMIQQVRPKGLCNVTYKLVTKVIANRLKDLMPKVVSPFQSSFVPGRHSKDNIIIAQEMIHSMKGLKGRKQFMTIKLDLEKAYDRLNWKFIDETLKAIGIPHKLRSLIIECITSPNIQVLWNGSITEAFTPSRGIRQGCPLEPYLFVLCIERLSHMICREVEAGSWKPMRAGRDGPLISHLMFADDILLFAEASLEQMNLILYILDQFGVHSGQKVSCAKSSIFVSKSTPNDVRDAITATSGFQHTGNLGKYLGVPIIHGRVTKSLFYEVVSKIEAKLSGWPAASLSMAGRVTLVQSVLQTVPYYSMQVVRLPGTICDEVERLCRQFIWGDSPARRRLHTINLDVIIRPKHESGLGIRRLKEMNLAFWQKHVGNFLFRSQVFGCKYYCTSTRYRQVEDTIFKAHPTDSHFWRSLVFTWSRVQACVGWVLGNGTKVRFWQDSWLRNTPPLVEAANSALIPSLEQPVSYFVNEEGDWRWEEFDVLIPHDLALMIAAMPRPRAEVDDKPCWTVSDNRLWFSVIQSTYFFLTNNRELCSNAWKVIWRWKGPHRIRIFLWLAGHDALITNVLRARRGLTNQIVCSACGKEPETTLHVLRDCEVARLIWLSLVPTSLGPAF